MRVFSKVGLAAALVAGFALTSPSPASAATILTAGNVGSIDDDNVSLTNGDTGVTIMGDLPGGFDVLFTGNETLKAVASGQARIESNDQNGFNYLRFELVGASFTSLILDFDASAQGTADFLGQLTNGNPFSFLDKTVDGAGSPFYTFQATAGDRFSYIEFFSDVPILFVDLGQFRVGGAARPGGSNGGTAPEPASFALFGIGAAAAALARRRRKN